MGTSLKGHEEACRSPCRHGRSSSESRQNRCGAERFGLVGCGVRLGEYRMRRFAIVLVILLISGPARTDARQDCYHLNIDACTELIRQNPEDSAAYLHPGHAYLSKGAYNKAHADYITAMGNDTLLFDIDKFAGYAAPPPRLRRRRRGARTEPERCPAWDRPASWRRPRPPAAPCPATTSGYLHARPDSSKRVAPRSWGVPSMTVAEPPSLAGSHAQ
jgi:hypothetical protein